MKTYLSDVIPSLKRASKKLDDVTAIKNTHWKLIDEETNTRVVYIFRNSNELLISKNGQVEKGSWEYLGSNSLLIEVGDKSFLFKQGFYNEYILGLKKDGVDEYAILINEDKIDSEIKTLKDLERTALLFSSDEVKGENELRPKYQTDESINKQTTSTKADIIIHEDKSIALAVGVIILIILVAVIGFLNE